MIRALSLALVFALAYWMPIPAVAAPVAPELVAARAHLPGWRVTEIGVVWEGGVAIEATCGWRRLNFKMVGGHFTRPGDFQVRPNDRDSAAALYTTTDAAGLWRKGQLVTIPCPD